MFSLIQIIKFPTRMTCGNLSLTDHVLARLPERISQEGEMNVGLSDHQLNYCNRKISAIKTGGVHNKIKFRSLQELRGRCYKNAPRKINLPNYEYFEDVSRVYSDVFRKLMTVIVNVD